MSAPERVEHDPATHTVHLPTGGCLEPGCSYLGDPAYVPPKHPHPAHEEGHASVPSGLCTLSGCEYTVEFLAGVREETSVVDQQPTDVGVPKPPDLCGTFAVYLLPDGTAGLVLAIEGQPEPRRQLLPKMVVDMVLHGKKPSLKDITGLMGLAGGKG